MKPSASEREAIVQFLARLYADIAAIENDFSLLMGDDDFRPRIDYFHDAVRAFTSADSAAREAGGRLAVESLAYDVEALRYLQSKPLARLSAREPKLSPGKEVAEIKPSSLAARPLSPDRATRDRLADLYQHYGLLFAALLKPFADRDWQERSEALNNDVRDIHALLDQFDHGRLDQALATIEHLEDQNLKQELMEFISAQKQKKREALQALLADLKKTAKRKDEEIKSVEKAHLSYGLAQLAIYESSKDLLKSMAARGMNLAGQFVENAMRATQREMGR